MTGALLLLVAVALLAALGASTRRLRDSLSSLSHTVRLIARGDYAVALQGVRHGDVADLALAMAELREGIEAREAELVRQASHDVLTCLPTRSRLLADLEVYARRGPFALVALGMRGFADINATLGFSVGDEVLHTLAGRLQRNSDVAARLFGDVFAVALPACSYERAIKAAEALGDQLRQPIPVEGIEVSLSVVFGVALFPSHASAAVDLLRRAELALSEAQRAGQQVTVYSPGSEDACRERIELARELLPALEAGELELHYQPKLEIATGVIGQVEALLRWRHPKRGFVPLEPLIALAEQAGSITQLTHWVVRTACAQLLAWDRAGIELRCSVNISSVDLSDRGFFDQLATSVDALELEPARLTLELTEAVLTRDPELACQRLERLRGVGFRIAVDDFGTGYSSLTHLRMIPADEVKIDKSFVRHLRPDTEDDVIVRSTIAIGHHMGLEVTAEGVEDRSTLRQLEAYGCDVAQGYCISPALPACDLPSWLEEYRKQDL